MLSIHKKITKLKTEYQSSRIINFTRTINETFVHINKSHTIDLSLEKSAVNDVHLHDEEVL